VNITIESTSTRPTTTTTTMTPAATPVSGKIVPFANAGIFSHFEDYMVRGLAYR